MQSTSLRIITLLTLMVVSMSTAIGARKRVLFIGDSITDGAWGNSKVWNTPSAERNQKDMNHIYGHGYMMICAAHYEALYPKEGLTFWNRGISGNTLNDLEARWSDDALALQPDVISILIGTNDAGRVLDSNKPFDADTWEKQYRALLTMTRKQLPDVAFVLCTPFVANSGRLRTTDNFNERQQIINIMVERIEAIAKDFNATLVPYHELFARLLAEDKEREHWVWDGIHPTSASHYLMAQMWIEQCNKLIIQAQ